MESKMFLVQPTVIDHAYIDHDGCVVGGSFNPDFVIGGKVDAKEKVVVDFSTVKKTLKAHIDDREQGFDHKLWLMPGYSKYQVEHVSPDMLCIKTPNVQLDLPRNAIKVLPHAVAYTEEEIEVELFLYLQECMGRSYPGIDIDIRVHNSAIPQTITPNPQTIAGLGSHIETFTYNHGLKDSTSWGCQNIAHGHLSFLQVFYERGRIGDTVNPIGLCRSISEYLDGTTFVYTDNVVPSKEPGVVTMEYETERGYFRAEYRRYGHKVVVLDTETTVEYLVSHVRDVFGERMRNARIRKLFLSEGLSKGAMVEL